MHNGMDMDGSPKMDSTKARQYDLTTVKGQLGNGALALHPQRQVWLASSCRDGENDGDDGE